MHVHSRLVSRWLQLLWVFGAILLQATASAQIVNGSNFNDTLPANVTYRSYTMTVDKDCDPEITVNPSAALRIYIQFIDQNGTTTISSSTAPAAGMTATHVLTTTA